MNLANIAHLCTRAQCDAGLAGKTAMRWIDAHLERRDCTFADLERESNRFANALDNLGLQPGEVLFTFLPKLPEQFFAVLGSLKLQLLTGTLFANFGDEALLDRLGDSRARVIVTKKSFLKKLLRIRPQLPVLEFIILVDDDHADGSDGICSYQRLINAASDEFAVAPTAMETPSVLHYTSGSTGKPKGVVHCHRSLAHQQATTRDVLGLRPDDIFWCTADQGWVTGTTYGIIGPWSLGVTQVHFGGGYDPARWFELLERERVTVWYTAPTALRMLMREDDAFT
jgi:acetyl-CoA synthetase